MRALRRRQQHIKPPRRPKPHKTVFERLRKKITERRRKHSLMSRAREALRRRRRTRK